jgi:hypothetical protein
MFALAAFCLLSGAPDTVRVEPAPEWNARFAGKTGWIGGDGVASAALGPDRVVWLFGDTIIGEVKNGGRAGMMVNNSLGLSGPGKERSLRFFFGKEKNKKPTSFFTPADGGGWFWPLSAIRLGKKLHLFFVQVEKTDGKGVFAFRLIGNWLITVDNPDDEPGSWGTRQQKLPFAQFEPKRERSWGSAVVASGDHLYVYGYVASGGGLDRRRLTVGRVPKTRVEDLTAWQFFSKTGWSAKATDAVGGASSLATEFSVGRLGDGRFVLIYTEHGLGDRIVGRFAREPQGPWSEPVLLYRCPEMAKDKGIFTYAGKAHSWASADNLLVSYCTNTWDFGRLFRDETVYRPRFVWVRVPR